jgi:hypothetical protein
MARGRNGFVRRQFLTRELRSHSGVRLPSDHGRAPVWRRRPLPTVAVTHFLALVDRSVALDGTVPEYWFPGQSRGNSSRDNH